MNHDATASGTLALTWEVDTDSITYARFARLVVERGFTHFRSSSWPTEGKSFDAVLDRVLTTQRRYRQNYAIVDLGELVGQECFAHLLVQTERIYVDVAAHDLGVFPAAKEALRSWFPASQPEEKQRIGITFWSLGRNGGRRTGRQIDVPAWAEIADNYPAAVRPRLGGLMGGTFEPGVGGRLILWHGEPGTGKTYALRALGWEWRSWCDLHYITDPETFFGSSPAYMLDVLLNEDDDDDEKSRWRLLVLEDTGELLAADAKARTGQGLSRLLNVVDGLIGQGLKILVLVTTNEPLGRLHAAVSRPGRCAVQTEFVRFTTEEAAEWLERQGRDSLGRTSTLASLYAGDLAPPERPKVGFTS
jgi:Domain of unknown function (DUF5925)/ATPase family associated with various cellular activities (AAA)